MRDYIIKLLGGYTKTEYIELEDTTFNQEQQIIFLKHDLSKAQRNDTKRDPKTGRFTK